LKIIEFAPFRVVEHGQSVLPMADRISRSHLLRSAAFSIPACRQRRCPLTFSNRTALSNTACPSRLGPRIDRSVKGHGHTVRIGCPKICQPVMLCYTNSELNSEIVWIKL
jgi:hypothetical protein